MSLFNFLIIILLFLFCFDVVRKIYLKPEEQNIIDKNLIKHKTEKKINNIKKSKENKDNIIENEDEDSDEFSIKNKKIKILIIYDNYSHEKDFLSLKYKIEQNYNYIHIESAKYPLPPNKEFFIKFTYITQIITCLLLLFPKYLKKGIPFLSNDTFSFIEKYNLILIFSNFFLHYILNKYISKSGAFEIIFKDKKIFSKLESGKLPEEDDLINLINNLL